MSVVDPIRDDAGWRFTRRRVRRPDQRLRLPRPRPTTTTSTGATASRCCGTSRRGGSSTTSPPTSCGCCRRCSRRWPSTRRARSRRADRRHRRAQRAALRRRQQRRLQGRLHHPAGRVRARGARDLRRARRDGRAPGFAPLPVRRRSPWRRTGACSRRSSASTPSTRSTSSARSSGSSTTRTCGRTCEICTSGRASAETVRFDEIRRHYFCTHPQINPSGLVALRPLEDFDAPHGRESGGGA